MKEANETKPILRLEGIEKSFGNTPVLKGISLHVARGEFVTLLGASGSGKTTILRIISGLESPDAGKVFLQEREVTPLPPNQRNLHTVFQSYALFPHMTVARNIGYSLRLQGVEKAEISRRVKDALALVRLEGYEKRKTGELSGGQRQRVAIARALVGNPPVLLLDEPLGALDLSLRHEMQTELKQLQKQLDTSFIYITHDQEEALYMSDRIAVLNHGVIEQIGTPEEIYDFPETAYVANFVGGTNLISGTLEGVKEGVAQVRAPGGSVHALVPNETPGNKVTLAVRREHIELSRGPKEGFLPALVHSKRFAGGQLQIILRLENNQDVIACRYGMDMLFSEGETVFVGWQAKHARLVKP